MTNAKDKFAIVTASASGIGLVVAQMLAREGWRVAMSDIDPAGEAEAKKIGASFTRCDMGKPAEIKALFAGYGPAALLGNNSGMAGPTLPVAELPVEDWQRVIDVNLTAHFVAAQCVIPGMIARGGGVIVNMSSVAGRIGQPNRSPYVASKWGVRGLTATLARELAQYSIRCNAILPGAVRGKRIERVIEAYAAKNKVSVAETENILLHRQASKAYIEPEEIAETILFLASDKAKSITGQFIGLDGAFD
ncbi:MAG: SDR family NAD(P)-dependent oxidoreductase [Candidatus Eiseniibacteriota bacterium]